MQTNKAAVDRAKKLIEDQQYALDSDWSEAQPSSDDENNFLEKYGWQTYGEWFLSEHPEHKADTKGHYGFPYGDFRRVHRSGLVAAKQRAAQNDYTALEKEADALLKLLDKQKE